MTVVLGIDPGAHGAMAVVEDMRVHFILDMPVWWQVTGKKKRPRLDPVELIAAIQCFRDLYGVDFAVIEAVGGRPAQSASAAYQFGYGVGLVMMALHMERVPVNTVPPATWKRLMRVPKDEEGIVHRADELFPAHVDLFRGPVRNYKGGTRQAIRHDRAEAAMLGHFGCAHMRPSVKSLKDLADQFRLADVGA